MKYILEKVDKKIYLISALVILVLLIFIFSYVGITNRIKENRNKEEIKEFEYKTYEVSGNIGTVLVTIRNEIGLEKVTYVEYGIDKLIDVFPNGKTIFAFDHKMEDGKHYEIKVEFTNGEQKTYEIDYEIPRIKGNYTLVGNTYANEPDLTGYVREKTRYIYLNENNNLVPGNWITDDKPTNWYNYEEQKWANIYVETDGIENYYVWIPRYVYKLNQDIQRADVKFINTYNEYIDGTTRRKIKMGRFGGTRVPITRSICMENRRRSRLNNTWLLDVKI